MNEDAAFAPLPASPNGTRDGARIRELESRIERLTERLDAQGALIAAIRKTAESGASGVRSIIDAARAASAL